MPTHRSPLRGQLVLRPDDAVVGRAGDRHRVAGLQQRVRQRVTDAARAAGDESDSGHAYRIIDVTVVILGAGDIGGALARQLAALDLVSRIVIVDDLANVASGKALDVARSGARSKMG